VPGSFYFILGPTALRDIMVAATMPVTPYPMTDPNNSARPKPLLRPACVLAALCILTAGPATGADRPRLAKTPPRHLESLPVNPDPPKAVLPVKPIPERLHRDVYAIRDRVRDFAQVSADLSEACRRGRFIQRLNLLFGVRSADDRPIGVAYGSGVNLHDPDRRSKLDLVYFFDRQDTSLCRVWFAPLDAVRPFLTRS
jgi:hypothetical protein